MLFKIISIACTSHTACRIVHIRSIVRAKEMHARSEILRSEFQIRLTRLAPMPRCMAKISTQKKKLPTKTHKNKHFVIDSFKHGETSAAYIIPCNFQCSTGAKSCGRENIRTNHVMERSSRCRLSLSERPPLKWWFTFYTLQPCYSDENGASLETSSHSKCIKCIRIALSAICISFCNRFVT